MSVRGSVRVTAAALTITVAGLAAAPAFAASEVAHGQASALNLTIAGNAAPSLSGQYVASNDGTTQTTSGSNMPPLTLPTGTVVDQGTLNQDATTSIKDRIVSSAACAGISGKGATLVALGSDASCLRPDGQPSVSLNAGQLKLDTVTGALTDNQLFDALPEQVRTVLADLLGGVTTAPGLGDLTTALNGIVTQLSTALGNPSVTVGAGVIQGQCTATQGSTTGDAQLVDAGVKVDFGTQAASLGLAPIDIALPSDPAPNTPLLIGVGDLTAQLVAAVTKQITASTAGTPLAALADQLTAAQLDGVVKMIVGQLTTQLGPLDQLLTGTLNKQTKTGDSQIHVTALDAQVLPAASQFTGSSLASIQLGDVDCLGGTAAGTTTPTKPRPASNVPTDIDSGLAGDSGGLPGGVLATFGALLLAAAGGVGVRRVRLHHGKG